MSSALLRTAVLASVLLSFGIASLAACAADSPPDLAHFLDLGKYYVHPVKPHQDSGTDFVVGGRNDTALLRTLTQINGRTIAELEADMRPGAKSDVGSEAGFLGPDEILLEVLTADNHCVVDELGLTHQELAKHLHAMGTIAFWKSDRDPQAGEFIYHGRRFKVSLVITTGTQLSPFRDGTESGSNVVVENLNNGQQLRYALLVPHMIERYGFYEGKGTPYRVDPRQMVEVFDFLKRPADGP